MRSFLNPTAIARCLERPDGEAAAASEFVDQLVRHGFKCLACDFDLTAVTVHSGGCIDVSSNAAQKLCQSVSQPFKRVVYEARARGLRCSIVTFADAQLALVGRESGVEPRTKLAGERLVRHVLEKNSINHLIDAVYGYYPPFYEDEAQYVPLGLKGPMPYSKSFHLERVRALYDLPSHAICLVDDDLRNCLAAVKEGYGAVWVCGRCGFNFNKLREVDAVMYNNNKT